MVYSVWEVLRNLTCPRSVVAWHPFSGQLVGWLVGVNTRGPQGPLLVVKVTSEVEGHNSLASLVLKAQLLLLILLIL